MPSENDDDSAFVSGTWEQYAHRRVNYRDNRITLLSTVMRLQREIMQPSDLKIIAKSEKRTSLLYLVAALHIRYF